MIEEFIKAKKLYKVAIVLRISAVIVSVVGIVGLWLLPSVSCFIHALVCILIISILDIIYEILEKKLTNLLKEN